MFLIKARRMVPGRKGSLKLQFLFFGIIQVTPHCTFKFNCSIVYIYISLAHGAVLCCHIFSKVSARFSLSFFKTHISQLIPARLAARQLFFLWRFGGSLRRKASSVSPALPGVILDGTVIPAPSPPAPAPGSPEQFSGVWYIQCRAGVTTISFRTFPPPSFQRSHLSFQLAWAVANTNLLSVSPDLPVLDISSKWNHTACGLW